jgi:hypothetical protein
MKPRWCCCRPSIEHNQYSSFRGTWILALSHIHTTIYVCILGLFTWVGLALFITLLTFTLRRPKRKIDYTDHCALCKRNRVICFGLGWRIDMAVYSRGVILFFALCSSCNFDLVSFQFPLRTNGNLLPTVSKVVFFKSGLREISSIWKFWIVWSLFLMPMCFKKI